MRVDFHPDALAELTAAAQFYESRRPELGVRFLESDEEAASRVAASPNAWRLIGDDVRRCITRVFPYGVLYTVESDSILIVAVAHLAREPEYWKPRL
jgi:hypothetical protein